MKFPVVSGTDQQIAELIREFEFNFGGTMVAMRPAEADNLSEDFVDAVINAGVVGVVIGKGGLDASNPRITAKLIHQERANRAEHLGKIQKSLEKTLQYHLMSGSSPLHNLHVTSLYLHWYKELVGSHPKTVLEAGHGSDHTGQTLACAYHRISFNGVSTEEGPRFNLQEWTNVLSRIGLSVDLEKAVRRVVYGQALENTEFLVKFPFIFAHVVLEHVAQPSAFLKKVYDLLIPGGYFITIVDLTGHGYSPGDLDFLVHNDEQWAQNSASGTLPNRLRHHEWLQLLNTIGFEVTCEIRMWADSVPPEAQARYPGVDLNPGMVRYNCRKPI